MGRKECDYLEFCGQNRGNRVNLWKTGENGQRKGGSATDKEQKSPADDQTTAGGKRAWLCFPNRENDKTQENPGYEIMERKAMKREGNE